MHADPQELTDAEYTVFERDFKKFDKNGNGSLDGDEILALIEHQLGKEPSNVQVSNRIHTIDAKSGCKVNKFNAQWKVAAMMDQMDKDHNGK